MIWLILLDILTFNLTTYNFHFIVLGIPFYKKINLIIGYFLILSFYDIRFLINLFLILSFYFFSKWLNTKINKSTFFKIIESIFYCVIYIIIFSFLSY